MAPICQLPPSIQKSIPAAALTSVDRASFPWSSGILGPDHVPMANELVLLQHLGVKFCPLGHPHFSCHAVGQTGALLSSTSTPKHKNTNVQTVISGSEGTDQLGIDTLRTELWKDMGWDTPGAKAHRLVTQAQLGQAMGMVQLPLAWPSSRWGFSQQTPTGTLPKVKHGQKGPPEPCACC